MSWWHRLFKRAAKHPLDGIRYQVAFTLYSSDGKRSAEVRQFENGETYVAEGECAEGTIFKDRHAGAMVGPFGSPELAERFVAGNSWFNGGE